MFMKHALDAHIGQFEYLELIKFKIDNLIFHRQGMGSPLNRDLDKVNLDGFVVNYIQKRPKLLSLCRRHNISNVLKLTLRY